MNDTPLWERFTATKFAPLISPERKNTSHQIDSSACECILQVGVFFDGTGNNEKMDLPKFAHSNIARLSKIYSRELNFFSIYIPGLGTPFPLIGEFEKSVDGSGFGGGGEGRIIAAILTIVNLISNILIGTIFFNIEEITALCSKKSSSSSRRDALSKYGLLLSLPNMELSEKLKFIKSILSKIKESSKDLKLPTIKELSVDIFGFSRGAAEARVFCHWLVALSDQSRIIDIPLRFRFLGLLDTVASVGMLNMGVNSVTGSTGGHSNWARADHLHILPQVENCVHFVAMHEQRKNFPLDTVSIGENIIPSNCQEYAYPGTHSDVGGGYAPGDLGIGNSKTPEQDDRKKLSQISLNHMYQCAVAAGVPFEKIPENFSENEYHSFALCPNLEKNFEEFLNISGPGSKRLSEWLLPYIVWRWQNRENYSEINQVVNASASHKKHLIDGNEKFSAAGARMSKFGDEIISESFVSSARNIKDFDANSHGIEYQQKDSSYLSPEAVAIHKRVSVDLKDISIPKEIADFFDTYVHDSVAGFREDWVEATGHWRYRRLFRGYDQPRLSSVELNDVSKKTV